jgi:transcription initiation factor TFIIIB Brf1 subunit/transcription initiation factor TFIIB
MTNNPPEPPKPKCPSCETELVLVNNELPEKCAKCGFVIEGYSIFENWFAKAMAKYEKAKEQALPKPEPIKKSQGVLSRLGRKG